MKRLPLAFFLVSMFLISLSSLAAYRLLGQDKQAGNLQYEVAVARKLIYVIVTDRKGRPITDLRKEDFSLTDNREKKQITEFENHTLSLPAKEGQMPAAVPEKEKPASVVPLMNRTFFFIFDLVFADPGGIRLAFQASQRFLEKNLEPKDEIGILSFAGGRSLNIHHLPSSDKASASLAIESIGLSSLMPIAPIRPFDENKPKIMTSGDATSSSFKSISSDFNVGRIVAGNFVWAMNSLAQALHYAPGRKVIVLYSNGIHPGYIGRGDYFDTGGAGLGRDYKNLCDNFAAAGVTVFTVNTEENTYLVQATPEFRKGVLSLREIASETGGRHLGDIYDVPDHMEKINTMTGAYYVLGYPIEEKWDGRFHKISVGVTRSGCEVNAQSGYFNPKPFSGYTDLEKRIHLIDLALSEKPMSQEPVRFDMQALPWDSAPPDDLRLISEIPVGRLEGVIGPRLEAVSLVFNELDELIDTRGIDLDLNLPEIQKKAVILYTALSAPPGNYKCRIVLRNRESGRAAVAAASTVILKPEPKGITLFPPLLLIPRKPSVWIGGGRAKTKNKADTDSTNGILFFGGLSLELEKYIPLIGESLAGGSEILASARCSISGRIEAEIAHSACLKNSRTGEVFIVPVTQVADRVEKDGKVLLLRLEIPEVAPGAYSLEVLAEAQGYLSRVVKTMRIR